MTGKDKLITALEGTPKEEIIQLLHRHRLEKLLVVDNNFSPAWFDYGERYSKGERASFANKDELEQLRVGAAVGVSESNQDRVHALVEAGVDVIIVDTAHGHSQGVIDQVIWVKKHYPSLQVIAGNIATVKQRMPCCCGC